MAFKLFLTIFLLVLFSGVVFAEGERTGTRIFQLDEITITEDVTEQEKKIPNITIILPELLLQGIGSTLDSALLRQPGIDVQRIQEVGGALDDESIKIRGFGSRRILLTIDGRTMNTSGVAGGYFIDWTTIPLSNIERIEVIKGVSDPRYGNVLGGVINLVTKKPSDKPVFELQGLAAKFDTRTFSFFHGWKPGKFEYTISGGYSESDGYLRNGDFDMKHANLYLGYELPWKGKIKTNASYAEVKKGFIVNNRASKDYDSPDYHKPINPSYPASDGEIMYGGMGAYPEMGSWWKKEKFYFDIGYEQVISDSILNVRYWRNYGEREAYNTRQSLSRIFHKKFFDDRSYGMDLNWQYYLANHSITVGAEYKRFKDGGDKNYSDDFRSPFRNENYVNSEVKSLYIMDDIKLSDKITVTPGLRFISYEGKAGPAGVKEGIKDISMDGFAPSLKFTYAYDKLSLLYISASSALRVPTPPEHYWHYSPDAGVDTSDLPFKKEEGIMLQGGWKTELPSKTRFEISPFYYRIKNYINFDLINFVSYNIDKASIFGFEAEVSQQIGGGFSIFANYTFQKSKAEGDPFVANFVAVEDRGFDEVPGLPRHKANLGLQYKGSKKERLALYARYVSDQKVIYNNNVLFNTDLKVREQESYVTADIEGSYPLTKNLEITAFLRNIFDKDYQEKFGFPAAGRNFGVGIKAVF